MRKIAVAVAVFLFALSTFAADDVVCKTDWGYGPDNGEARWGQLQPAYEACDSGMLQSPVVLGQTSTTTNQLTLTYSNSPIALQRTAHALNVFTLGLHNRLTYGTINARLTKFHFHAPAEHAPAGIAKGELHLVHFQGNAGYVVAIFIDDDGTSDNPAIAALLSQVPDTACTSVRLPSFPLTALRPSTTNWTMYTGSLTTPPCSEGVTFFVMKQHMKISHSQFLALAALSEGARGPQLVNGRPFGVR